MLFFYLLSVKLSKTDFGLISWASATAMTLTAVLSFGLEVVVTRRIATSRFSSAAWSFFLHAAFTTLILGIVLFVIRYATSPTAE